MCTSPPSYRYSAPYLPEGTLVVHPVTKDLEDLGGTRAGDAAAQVAGWPKVLALLAAAGH
ncbi:hypothetical protein P3T35_001638 [Kitasatospora sp. GP30]|uniref:hypothetical protein n=1 Tax=Kitasatospora sp. GP30 TaxID=3035084 RepID=UPI000C714D9D|nr:hypothetical protein [Kitasatospora sp. GP30]MDH6139638.1 hypothetical protein [Kitasatospora sp. GP30]